MTVYDKVVMFDYCAVLVIVTLIVSALFRRMVRGRSNKIFFVLMSVILVTVLFDVCALNIDRLGPGHETWKYFFHSMYLLLHNATAPIYIIYQLALTDTWHRLRKYRSLLMLLIIPISAVAILIACNPFNHYIFYLDQRDCYTRGPGFLALYVASAVYFVYGFVYLVMNRNLLSKQKVVSLLVIYPAMAVAVAIQYFFPRYSVEMFANAITLLFISVMIQRPEEVMDVETGLLNLQCYHTDIRRSFATRKQIHIIMVTLVNYNTLSTILDFDGIQELMKRIADYILSLCTKGKLYANIYYIGEGRFRIVLERRAFGYSRGLAERINRALKSEIPLKRMNINLLANVCVVRCPSEIDNYEALQNFGKDVASRNCFGGEVLYAYELFQEEYYDIVRDIDGIIQRAFQNHSFEVYYQPIYSLEEKRFNSAEALLRLYDEERGFISPEIFIPAAEKSGAIHKIGDFVLREVCSFISSEEYKKLNIDYIEVNLSVVQCMRNKLSMDVLGILGEYRVNPNQINLEITETAASFSQNTMMENIDALVHQGIPFSLDDFGTGYSNMRRVASMPFHIVKLDKTFTEMDHPNMKIVVENTIRMIKSMNMKIVVEGVETKEMLERFSQLQCEYIQGYYYSKPIPKQEFIRFITENNKVQR